MFSIIIPTLNNVKYLMLCIKSIYKNSKYKHEIIPHVNIGDDGTTEFLKKENIKFTYTEENSGICKGVNLAAKISTNDYILYAHDDFYFCPNWDEILKLEIDKIGHNNFYLSGTMMYNGQIKFNCGDTLENFDENIIGLTGSSSEINEVMKKYKIFKRKSDINNSDTDYLIDHTSLFYFVGKDNLYINHFSSKDFVKTASEYFKKFSF